MKADWFKDTVKSRWSELRASGALDEAAKTVLSDAEALEKDLGEEAWKIDKVKEIITFVYGRIDFLDGEWGV